MKNHKKIIAILILAAVIRLLGLNQSLWHDEAIAAQTVINFSIKEYFTNFLPGDFHPPIYFFIQKIFYFIFGSSEFSFRLPALLSGVLTVYFVYLISIITIQNKKYIFWPTILCALSPILIQYSFEARPYSLTTLVVTINIYLLLRIKNKFSKLTFITYLTSCVVLIYLNYLSYFYLIISSAFMINILIRQKEIFKKSTIFFSLIAITISSGIAPILNQQLAVGFGISDTASGWQKIIGSQNIFKNIVQFCIKIISGHVDFDYSKLSIFISGIGAILLLTILMLSLIKRGKEFFLTAIFLMVLLLIQIVSMTIPIYSYFRLLYLVPLILISISVAIQHYSRARYVFYYFFISSLIFNFMYFLNPVFWRENWKGAAEYTKYLTANYQNSIVVFPTAIPYEAYSYYNHSPAIGIGKDFIVTQLTQEQELELKKYQYLIVYDYLAQLTDPKGITKNFLNNNYNELTGYSFNKIGSIRLYSLK